MAKDLQRLFTSKGFNPVIGTIYQQQQYWLAWYRGDVDGFHNIQKKNVDGVLLSIQKPSLQMAKKVAEDWTSLLFNEKVALTVSGNDNAQDVLDNALKENNFFDEMPNFIELTAGAYGTGLMVEYQVDGKTKMNYLFGDKVIIIDYDNTTPKAVAVIQQFQKNKRKYLHVMYHTHKEGMYRIQHEMYSSKNAMGLGSPDSLSVLFSEKELKAMRHTKKEGNVEIVEYYKEYETEVPHFQLFKFAITNNYDVQSPMGITVTANSQGTLENIDEKYYSSRMDSINSRKRVFIDEEASKLHKTKDAATGKIKWTKYFDQDETQYQVLKGMANEHNKAVEAYAPQYDSSQHDNAIQMELNYLSSKVGLGTNYYSYQNGAVGYQNEMNVIASNSDTFRNRQKNINRLNNVLINMMKSIMYLEKDNGNFNGDLDSLEYNVQFDDDIMTDDATVIEQYRKDAIEGVIPVEKYLMKAYKITEEEALEMIGETTGVNKAKTETVGNAIERGVMSMKESQKAYYGETKTEEELDLIYIDTKIEKGMPITPKEAERYEELTGQPITNQGQ